MTRKPHIEIDGLKELQRTLRRLKDRDLDARMRKVNKDAAQIVVDDSIPHAPRRTGALASSVKAVNSTRHASVKAGTPSRVPYAGAIHYGWRKRNIKPQPFLSVGIVKKRPEIEEAFEKGIRDLAETINTRKGI